jgi:L-arabinokinase
VSRIVFYVSSHGFGHASRDIEVTRALARLEPHLRVAVRTAVPRWFFEPAIDVQAVETDTGVAQIDSMRIDERATASRAAEFHRTFEDRVEAEAAVLSTLGATVVVGDVPALAFAAARRAGVPSVLLANFTWDWIYGAFPDFEAEAPGVIAAVRDAYAGATMALRLPLHGPLAPVAGVVTDIPLIARRSRLGRAEARRRLLLDGTSPVVLASFGRYGAALPYETIARDSAFTLLVTTQETGGIPTRPLPRLKCMSPGDLQRLGLEYQDLVAAADVVVSKPGYGIVSECVANGAALLYTTRGRFPEYDVFVREMPGVLQCRPISDEDLHAGRWVDGVTEVLQQPMPPRTLAVDGAEVAAHAVASLIGGAP